VNPKGEYKQTDQQLVEKVLRGDTHAFGAIIKNTEGLVAGIIIKMIPNTEDRKDLVQDSYLKAFHKLAGFKFQSKLSTWIGQITYHNCLNWLEKKRLVFPGEPYVEEHAESMHSPGPGSGEDLLIQKQLSGMLQVEIDKLSPVYRTLVSLYHQQELSYAELAQITGLPEGTVKSYLFRARKKLKENVLSKYKKEVL
jgi:RNA polymerase sigma factor (sigma-70 family)